MNRLSNLFSRTPKEKPSAELIHPKLQLPPDGTYPPRLLVPGCSIWLKEGAKVDLGKGLTVEARDGACYLYQTDAKHQFYLNGQFLPSKIRLKDGDFIHNKRTKMIFQQDPVADYRKVIEIIPSRHEPFTPSENLRKHVYVDEHRISINGKVDFFRWDELLYVAFVKMDGSIDVGLVPIDALHNVSLEELQKTPSLNWSSTQNGKLLALNGQEFKHFLDWVHGFAPFDYSTFAYPRGLMFDIAYHNAVVSKVVKPAEAAGLALPANREFILNIKSESQAWRGIILALLASSACCFFSVSNFLTTDTFGIIVMAAIVIGAVFHYYILPQFRYVRALRRNRPQH